MAVRFTMPLSFRKEADANSCCEASGLFPLGARAMRDAASGRWLICVDARVNPKPIREHLKCITPGIAWLEETIPAARARA